MDRLKKKEVDFVKNDPKRQEVFDAFVKDLRKRQGQKYGVTNTGRGAKEDARTGIFNKRRKLNDGNIDNPIVAVDGVSSFDPKGLTIKHGKDENKSLKYKDEVLQTKKDAVYALRDIGKSFVMAFKSNDDHVGDVVNWIQDNIQDENEQEKIIDSVYEKERRWCTFWRGIVKKGDKYDKDTIKKKMARFVAMNSRK